MARFKEMLRNLEMGLDPSSAYNFAVELSMYDPKLGDMMHKLVKDSEEILAYVKSRREE